MRYLPLTPDDRAQMLGVIGAATIDDLFADVPAAARKSEPFALQHHAGELEVERELSALAGLNRAAGAGPFFCGAGAYRHHVPATVDHIIQRSEFLTSYTPYQPEIAQGTLQVLFEFQTQVAALTGLDVANASMYDGSTACAEAVMMARRVTRRKRAVLSGGLHPHYAATTQTIAHAEGMDIVRQAVALDAEAAVIDAIDSETACVVVQTPNVFGTATDVTAIAEAAHAAGALLIVVTTEAVSYGLLKSPGEMGADIAVAEGQSIGNALNFGGPYIGLFTCREKLVRQMPGRLCGETVDAEGRRGFVLTLSTREQHIRRDKATSNICTNSGLCALAFTVHLSLLGETGLRQLAAINHAKAQRLAGALGAVTGVEVLTRRYFNEIAIRLPGDAARMVEALLEDGIVAGVPFSRLDPAAGLDDVLLCAATETTLDEDIDAFAQALSRRIGQ
ncbi:aminomethyl-transferring glycine dehydrogenase subunit GcvPA [Phenylobacterium sp.]|uniref:aminomethyl-transferring glycine dehydrogenase subunit GcvPA n=1 Tax=Phenylobacterium sp. TaxID=1871053 RepID=UPI00272EFA24|nr:aminomethyl-transferring glycine dehydrogenase subunit GcvPA [Phenylobacterium sp.]MDP1874931.1 aminomethyl-transferring glycine dehydrogenase subunit GcvPA [Phenylobacterium sp.]MDP3298728.1 aminomethyl-transferring glycine dehydrogenase subunit GcvPA [Phenylobacterium sp.]MDP3491180.1 aminomethyl-transferring glycine dehydrogenase subunit GcvPA [Phenylobacterium sp.]